MWGAIGSDLDFSVSTVERAREKCDPRGMQWGVGEVSLKLSYVLSRATPPIALGPLGSAQCAERNRSAPSLFPSGSSQLYTLQLALHSSACHKTSPPPFRRDIILAHCAKLGANLARIAERVSLLLAALPPAARRGSPRASVSPVVRLGPSTGRLPPPETAA